MNLDFKTIEASDLKSLLKFYGKRPNKTCDSVVLDSFIWQKFYNVRFAISENKAIQWLMEKDNVLYSAMPICAEEDLPYFFNQIVEYFNYVLHKPFKINLADEEAVNYLHLDPKKFQVTEMEDLKDYLYSGNSLRTLSGKKLHKKKNHLNNFIKTYEGRYDYKKLCCSYSVEIREFLNKWSTSKGDNIDQNLDYEIQGIHEILKNCVELQVQMGGVFIDNKLEGFSIGSYNDFEKMAIIHIEKANHNFNGLYQFINQQFLLHEFPDIELINREDDLGLEGLRKAKMSYNPLGFARKYKIVQKDW